GGEEGKTRGGEVPGGRGGGVGGGGEKGEEKMNENEEFKLTTETDAATAFAPSARGFFLKPKPIDEDADQNLRRREKAWQRAIADPIFSAIASALDAEVLAVEPPPPKPLGRR